MAQPETSPTVTVRTSSHPGEWSPLLDPQPPPVSHRVVLLPPTNDAHKTEWQQFNYDAQEDDAQTHPFPRYPEEIEPA